MEYESERKIGRKTGYEKVYNEKDDTVTISRAEYVSLITARMRFAASRTALNANTGTQCEQRFIEIASRWNDTQENPLFHIKHRGSISRNKGVINGVQCR